MHELGVAKDLWHIIRQYAQNNNLASVTKIIIVVGEASGIEVEFLEHSLRDHTLKGTIAEKAELEFKRVPLAARCTSCGSPIGTDTLKELACPRCSSAAIDIVTGKELYVESIEGE